MTRTYIRDFHGDDLDQIVRLWGQSTRENEWPIYSLAEVIASCQQDYAVVAVQGDVLVGAAVGRAAHAQGWIVFFGIAGDNTSADVSASLLHALERRMAPLGLSKLSVLIPEADGLDAFTENGFEVHHSVRYVERDMPIQRREIESLKEVGGRMLPPHLWERVAGMSHEKTLLEERLVTPLARPELAERFGVVPPRAVMLFGPPGTARRPSPGRWPLGSVGRSSSSSPRASPTAAQAWPVRCAPRSRRSTNWSMPWSSSTKSRRSPRGGAACRRPRPRA